MSKNLPYKRAERIADEIYRIIARAIVTDLADPRLSGTEITHVRMTPDLSIARVYFHLADGEKSGRERVQKGLDSARGYIKRLIGKELVLRFMPEIEFYYDESVDVEEKIEELLNSVKRKA